MEKRDIYWNSDVDPCAYAMWNILTTKWCGLLAPHWTSWGLECLKFFTYTISGISLQKKLVYVLWDGFKDPNSKPLGGFIVTDGEVSWDTVWHHPPQYTCSSNHTLTVRTVWAYIQKATGAGEAVNNKSGGTCEKFVDGILFDIFIMKACLTVVNKGYHFICSLSLVHAF